MKKNFRFFDNRQKYLLFVTTTNEKNVIADNIHPYIKKIKPTKPALKIFDAGMGDGSLLMNVMRQSHQEHPNIPLLVSTKEVSMEDVRLGYCARIQTGFVFHYAFAMLIGVVIFVTWYYLRIRGVGVFGITWDNWGYLGMTENYPPACRLGS